MFFTKTAGDFDFEKMKSEKYFFRLRQIRNFFLIFCFIFLVRDHFTVCCELIFAVISLQFAVIILQFAVIGLQFAVISLQFAVID